MLQVHSSSGPGSRTDISLLLADCTVVPHAAHHSLTTTHYAVRRPAPFINTYQQASRSHEGKISHDYDRSTRRVSVLLSSQAFAYVCATQ